MSFENRGPAYQGLAPTLWFKHVAVIDCKVQISIALHLVEGRSSMITIVSLCLNWALLTANPPQTQTLSCQQHFMLISVMFRKHGNLTRLSLNHQDGPELWTSSRIIMASKICNRNITKLAHKQISESRETTNRLASDIEQQITLPQCTNATQLITDMPNLLWASKSSNYGFSIRHCLLIQSPPILKSTE